MDKWAYLIQCRITDADYAVSTREWLDIFGQSGWELVAVLKAGSDTMYFFKRRLKPEN